MGIVQSSHIRLHGTRLRVHAHETAAQESLVIADGIQRTHHRVDISVIGEHGHRNLLPEGCMDFVSRESILLHLAIALALGHAAVQYHLNLLRRQLVAVWRTRLACHLLAEGWLQIACHMLIHGLFGISLHAAVDGGKHLQSVAVDIVWRTILLIVLVAPAKQWVGVPEDGIGYKLRIVPRCIILSLRAGSHHIFAQIFTQISGRTVLVVGAVEVEREWFSRILAVFAAAQIARLLHLREHHVSSVAGTLRIAHWVEERRVLAESDERSCLGEGQVFRLLIKIGVCRRLDAHGIVQEVEIVEIESQDFLLGVVPFQFHGDDPLYRFLQLSLQRARCLFGIELLGKLLRDGTSTSGIGLTQDTALHDGTPQRTEVDARMLVESFILRGNECLY